MFTAFHSGLTVPCADISVTPSHVSPVQKASEIHNQLRRNLFQVLNLLRRQQTRPRRPATRTSSWAASNGIPSQVTALETATKRVEEGKNGNTHLEESPVPLLRRPRNSLLHKDLKVPRQSPPRRPRNLCVLPLELLAQDPRHELLWYPRLGRSLLSLFLLLLVLGGGVGLGVEVGRGGGSAAFGVRGTLWGHCCGGGARRAGLGWLWGNCCS